MRYSIFLYFVLTIASQEAALAQWQNAGFSSNYPVIAFGIHDTSFFLSYTGTDTRDSLIWSYRPPGQYPWDRVKTTGIDRTQGNITTFASLGKYFFAGSGPPSMGSGYLSTDNGSTWTDPIGGPIGTNGTYVFGQYATRIARSRDSGLHWEHLPYPAGTCYAAISGLYVFAATSSSGLYRSTDSGGVWAQVTTPISNIRSFAVIGSTIYGSNGTPGQSGGQLARSIDNGATWSLVATTFDVSSLATDGKHLFAGGSSGAFLLDPNGSTWTNENGDGALKGRGVVALGVFDTLLFADFANGLHVNYELYSRSIPEMTDSTTSAVAVAAPTADRLDIYPNPARGIVTIVSGGASIERVIVMNLLGEKVLEVENVRAPEISMDISKLPAGTYFFEIQTSHGPQLRKIAIER